MVDTLITLAIAIGILFVIAFLLRNYLLFIINEQRRSKINISSGRCDRLHYSHLKYGDTLGWTITNTWVEPKTRKNYITRPENVNTSETLFSD